MRKKKKIIKRDRNFNKKNGTMAIITGIVSLWVIFVSQAGSDLSFLKTEINNPSSSSVFEGQMSWEAVMTVTLSIALIIAGMIMFFVSGKIKKE